MADKSRYASKEVLDAHMACEPVKDLIAMMTNDPVLAGAPTIRTLSFLDDMEFAKGEAAQLKDPHIVFADIEYSTGKRDATLEHWKKSIQSTKDESGCFVYGLAKDEAKPDTHYVVEVYQDKKWVDDVHMKSSYVQELVEKTKDAMTGMRLSNLQLRGGYVAK
jgi:quinol monooxygenase YgiN